MGSLESDPTLDAEARAAVVAAAAWTATLPAGATREQLPYWTLGHVATARNAPAQAMEAAILAATPTSTGDARRRIVARAARWGLYVLQHGGGDAGWAKLAALRRAG